MQLHDHSDSAPALAAHGQNGQPRRMQNHAPVACTAKNGKFAENDIKNLHSGCRFGSVSTGQANASRGSLFNPASTESEFQHRRRLSYLIVEYRIDFARSHVDACRYGLFDHATISISAAKSCFYNGMRVFIQNQMVDR